MAKRQGYAPSFCRVPSGLFSSSLPFYCPMPQAIIRIAKIKTKSAAQGKTKHNYRLMATHNADPERTATLNQELVNTGQLDYWTLAEKRTEEGIAKTARGKPRTIRDDQVRAVEVILTASPDWFKRDGDKQAEDVRGSQWVTDNLDFLKNKYGEKNVVSFTLHQDETTPHIHAVVIPLTDKGRLSADTLFNRETLKELQTDYAKAMAPHGLERGVEGSRRQHQDMKQVYGRQDKTAAGLSSEVGPPSSYQVVKVDPPSRWENLESWAAKTTDQVNEKARAQVEEANERAQKAIQYAIANAGSKEQAEVLNRQLNVLEGVKQGNFDQTQAERAKLDELAMRLASGEAAPKSVLERGQQALDQAFEDIKAGQEKIAQLHERLNQADNKRDTDLIAKLRYGTVPEEENRQKELETRFRGFQGGTERLDQLGTEQVKAAADKVEQAKKDEKERDQAAQNREIIAQGDRENARKAEALRVQKHELSLMDQAFTIYRWNIRPDELTACLLVPKDKAELVVKALTIEGSSYAASLWVQGEPMREDELKAVYVKYQASFAHQIGSDMDRIREIGGQVYEHAGSQAKREQLEAKPSQEAQKYKQEPAQTKEKEMGD